MRIGLIVGGVVAVWIVYAQVAAAVLVAECDPNYCKRFFDRLCPRESCCHLCDGCWGSDC
jgi:hypothetical protein